MTYLELKEIIENHEKWLKKEYEGKYAYLVGADLSDANFCDANLRRANFSSANLSGADLRCTNLRQADLSGANLIGADLRQADLTDAYLVGANLSGADLRYADLSGANLRYANLSGAKLGRANLIGADLSGAENLLSATDYLQANFEFTSEGLIAYKCFNGTYSPSGKWVIKTGSVITENINANRTDVCGCGINVAPLGWTKNHCPHKTIWKVLIRWEWLCGVCVPYNTDGNIRCEKVELLNIV